MEIVFQNKYHCIDNSVGLGYRGRAAAWWPSSCWAPYPAHLRSVGFPHKDHEGRLVQCSSLVLREAPVTSLDKVMIEGGVGALWRTDGHDGEVQVVDGAGGDRGGHRGLLPLLVRLADQQSCSQETKADHPSPQDFEGPCL